MKHFYTLLKSSLTVVLLLLFMGFSNNANACNANYSHTNGCVGDTIWFYAVDQYAIYTWDFGDSTSQSNVNHDTVAFHVYDQPGTYYVTLFVNIGAEWDYQTQIITIGADCFYADFTTQCGGSNSFYFYDNSGGNTSILWNFGDPASGGSNISTLPDPYHTFTAAGSYVVTLIAYSDTDADTTTQTIYVSANCLGVTLYPNISGYCAGQPATVAAYYSGNVTSYNWNFGDPSSGVNNSSTDMAPSHTYAEPGCYLLTLIISDGFATDTTYAVIIVEDCTVWSGDANADGEVNADDIFPIGMYYSRMGVTRPNASIAFASQPSTDWPNYENFMYLQKMVNSKMADCNGDATINNLDVAAISQNFGMRHNNHNNRSSMHEATPANPTMYIDVIPTTANAGNNVTASVYLGTSAIPISYLYGYSFTVNYNPALVVPGSMAVNLNNNWLGNLANEVTVTHDDAVNGKLDVGVVRTDKVQPASGYGQIASITFQLKPNVSGNLDLSLSSSAKVLTTTMYGSITASNTEIFMPVNLTGDVLEVLNPLGLTTTVADNAIELYPNPTASNLTISTSGLNNTVVEFFDISGRKLLQQKLVSTNTVVDLTDFANGVYVCQIVQNGKTVKHQKVVVSH